MKVVSSARKLIFRPEAGAPVVDFPEGVVVNSYGPGNENPLIVVCNATETNLSWQGVDYETGCVIVNGVPEDVAEQALDI